MDRHSQSEEQRNGALSSVRHWDFTWQKRQAIRPVSRFDYFDSRFVKLFESLNLRGKRVLEVGCGGSRWMRYLAETLHCETWGIDYSPDGLALIRQDLGPLAAQLNLVQGDFFEENPLPKNSFDLVYSAGFIEHFSDPTCVTSRLSDLLRPGGVAVTLVPNFMGLNGLLQRTVDEELYRQHVVINPAMLDDYHQAVGLSPLNQAEYWGCFATAVVNYNALRNRLGGISRLLLPLQSLFQQACCWSLHLIHLDVESRLFSPYVVGVYQKAQPDKAPSAN
jgi:SAM-dependent methyltransferase